jgi:dihydrofolate reductase
LFKELIFIKKIIILQIIPHKILTLAFEITTMLTIIAAASENNALGKDNQLVWHLPDDFKRFKSLTSGHFIVMGRKTFESFPKPLPNRTHIIITRQKNYEVPEGCFVASSLQKAIALCPKEEEVFIIGGGEIYKQSIEIADKIDLTRVHTTIEADTFFPEIDETKWELVFEKFHTKDEKHDYDFTFLTYVKR